MVARSVVIGSVLGVLAMSTGCASAPKAPPATATTAAEVAATNRDAWVSHDEFEMSISGEKERQVHQGEETALRPLLVTQQRSRQ